MTITRNRNLVAFGQSYAADGLNFRPGYEGLVKGLQSVSSSNVPLLINTAENGSAIREENAGLSAGHWVNNDGTAGSHLTNAVSEISTQWPGNVVAAFIWSHGEQEATKIIEESTWADMVARADRAYDAAESRLLPDIRAAIHATNGGGMAVFADLPGPRFRPQELGEYAVRDRLLEWINTSSSDDNFRGAEKYAVPLDDTTHPSDLGYFQLGVWQGRKLGAWYANTGVVDPAPGPSIDTGNVSVTNPSDPALNTTITVPIITPSGETLVMPDNPDFFGVWDANGARLRITASGSGSNVTLTVLDNAAPATLRYPAAIGDRPFDQDNIIRLSRTVTGDSREMGLPLESIATLAL